VSQLTLPLRLRPPLSAIATNKGRHPARWVIASLLLLLGLVLRVVPTAGFTGTGFDEGRYREYVTVLDQRGIAGYPEVFQFYLKKQRAVEDGFLPPTRITYITGAFFWRRARFGSAPAFDMKSGQQWTRDPALVSLHSVSTLFSILMLPLVAACAWRMVGPSLGLGTLALVAFSPLELHMSQHALMDGFFAFWTLLAFWLLWENLRRPRRVGLEIAYLVSLALLVLTKETSAFVAIAFLALMLLNRWLKFGTVTPRLLILTAAGGVVGLAILGLAAGGFDVLLDTLQLNAAKTRNHPVAVLLGDGPWYRYLLDMMALNPLLICLAIGGLFFVLDQNRVYLFSALFIAITYLIMCNLPYGANLRYATIWDFSIALLAVGMLKQVSKKFGKRASLIFTIAVALLCAFQWRQYNIFFVQSALYELDARDLFKVLHIVK
jgi:hypothetical protein